MTLDNLNQENQKAQYLNRLISLAEETDFPTEDLSKLNVMSWPNYASVIRRHWPIFSSRFAPLSSQDLEDRFVFLKSCRDCSGHHNTEVLSQPMRERLKTECTFLLKRCDPLWTPLSSLSEDIGLETASDQTPSIDPVPTEEAPLLGMEVVLVETTRGSRGNLRGFIQETDIRVSIPKVRLGAVGINAAQLAGNIVRVRLLSWDQNAGAYISELSGS